ncbi:MAG TPA: ABC transporter ATP-binding protein [Chloroflexota bacterium]|nr:ABC transporter ATP-binding protein [Chloroflexota bacterium]
MDRAIATSGLTKRYGDRAAVDRMSLTVGQGEIYGFLGLNGAGKTTTIRMLLGMIRPTSGTAQLFGTRVQAGARELWSRVGYLVETPHAYPELTVRENLEATRRLRHIADPKAVERTMERLALDPYADQRAGTLSLGNAQRLGLARALLHEPELLILDEPANGLDPAGVVEVREMLIGLARDRGVTVFMSSHILSEVARIATRIGVIHEGRLIEELSTEELERRRRRWVVVDARSRPAARAVLTFSGYAVEERADGALQINGERALARPEHIAMLLVEAGSPPTRLAVEQEELETHFLRLVGTEGRDEAWPD